MPLLYVVHVAVHLSQDTVPGLEHCLSLAQPDDEANNDKNNDNNYEDEDDDKEDNDDVKEDHDDDKEDNDDKEDKDNDKEDNDDNNKDNDEDKEDMLNDNHLGPGYSIKIAVIKTKTEEKNKTMQQKSWQNCFLVFWPHGAAHVAVVVLRHINDDRVGGVGVHLRAVSIRPAQHVPNENQAKSFQS